MKTIVKFKLFKNGELVGYEYWHDSMLGKYWAYYPAKSVGAIGHSARPIPHDYKVLVELKTEE